MTSTTGGSSRSSRRCARASRWTKSTKSPASTAGFYISCKGSRPSRRRSPARRSPKRTTGAARRSAIPTRRWSVFPARPCPAVCCPSIKWWIPARRNTTRKRPIFTPLLMKNARRARFPSGKSRSCSCSAPAPSASARASNSIIPPSTASGRCKGSATRWRSSTTTPRPSPPITTRPTGSISSRSAPRTSGA